ncbi:DUF418 domain-containing protein [Nesterenkonia sp. HG001]|uniref:DUF418 domain-containing protein n=1 Tax=Nesterenkonia sp. HG001 TaxID=2983207 RepID=UPI002AC5685F|nr:DUF418 domain-containing protein [Nesterenkonia sp. HG001]MDZ5077369.1 DUF418 domain-containing protein [Nesterenkonia sp. HG001]
MSGHQPEGTLGRERHIDDDGGSSLPMPSGTQPARPPRLIAVDALRAVALLGILSVNIWFFAEPGQLSTGEFHREIQSAGDQLTAFTATLLFEAKSYVVFSFLFGLSFVMQWASAHRAGVSEVGRSVRRFITLAVLGVLHGILLFVGDILLAYALLGFALLGMRRIRTRTALILAGLLYGVVALFMFGISGIMLLAEGTPGFDDAMMAGGDADAAVAAYTGTIGSYLGFQLQTYAFMGPMILFGQGIMVLAAFLIGLVVGRSQLLERIVAREVPTGRLVAIMVPALTVGLLISGTAAWLDWGAPGSVAGGEPSMVQLLLAQALTLTGGPVQSLGYVILALLVFRSPAFGWLTAALAPAGRMSLTNYLGQSLVLALIFSALGLGLAGQLTALQVGGIALALWLVQLLASRLWMTGFRTGPLEAPVRAITYGRAPRWR